MASLIEGESVQYNIYYSPEQFGLEQVALIDYSDGSYRFDLRVVWKRTEDGHLLTARNAGCSCPSPFEDHDMMDLQPFILRELESEAIREGTRVGYDGGSTTPFLDTIRRLDRERH